ncbi:MAG TPA: TolC family protein [Gemmatimonadales bacterium]|nr:TolC family protein [Gemmatimonadales bacterium]
MLALLFAVQVAAPASDSVPRVTLAEALQRAARLDPNYVAALGQIDNAVWARRSAFSVFVLPSITLSTDVTHSNPPGFNFVTFAPEANAVTAQVSARYDLFTGGQKLAELSRSAAALEGAHAGELVARFAAALLTESDYYAVLAGQELQRVARERVRRAEEQLAVARARVASGAAVQTDSLQLRLELTRARVGRLVQESALRVARLELGRRVGAAGAVDAAPLDTAPAPELPLTLADAIAQAAEQGPQYRVARANERAAGAAFRARLGDYLPRATLSGNALAFDNRFFPTAIDRTALTLSVSFPVWDNVRREIAVSQARVNRDVARAVREDMDRAVQRDVTAAYDGYVTARASTALAREGVRVARESFRVQQSRYFAGATTSLDLLEAQVSLAEAEAQLVQAQYATRLALAGLESILGRRLFTDKVSP